MAAAREIETPTAASDRAEPEKTLYCSFCYKSHYQVKKLISGPANIFVCDECVELCNEIIAARPPSAKPPSAEELPTERLLELERLEAIEDTVQGKGNQLQQAVDLCALARVSWAVIRAALGISRQAAWERFT